MVFVVKKEPVSHALCDRKIHNNISNFLLCNFVSVKMAFLKSLRTGLPHANLSPRSERDKGGYGSALCAHPPSAPSNSVSSFYFHKGYICLGNGTPKIRPCDPATEGLILGVTAG